MSTGFVETAAAIAAAAWHGLSGSFAARHLRRTTCLGLLGGMLLLATSAPAFAQYPDHLVKIINPYAVGGSVEGGCDEVPAFCSIRAISSARCALSVAKSFSQR